jgi:lipoprotein-anchoring transpeptidase ErfK/SrfK
MSIKLSRRDFLKLSSMALGGMAFSPFAPDSFDFDDSSVARITTDSVSVYSEADDESRITGTWYRDELVHIYDEVVAEMPEYNPVWYRVWGGYMHRARLQRVKYLYNQPLTGYRQGLRSLVEVTVPFTQPWRFTRTYGWEPLNPLLYYESVHWIEDVDEGPDGDPWYLIYDDLTGNYHVKAQHLRPIPAEELAPISPDVPKESKRLEVDLSTQILRAYEYDKPVFQTHIASGIPAGRRSKNELSTKTPNGTFNIQEKMPAKHMGNGNLFAGADDYELPGVSWTCFFTEAGHAFHGTYWHDNFGTPMSHGCINMRTEEARWLFRWVYPVFDINKGKIYERGLGTPITILYS